jgi:hypothetical protein
MFNSKIQKTVKAFDSDIALINDLAKRRGCSAAEFIHTMCEQLRKQQYLQELGESFDLLKASPKQFAEFQKEQSVWDPVSSDGLDDDAY